MKRRFVHTDGRTWYATMEEEHGVVTVHGNEDDLALAKTIYRTKKFKGEQQAPWAKVVLATEREATL